LQLVYFKVAGGNFGDDLNTWLWDELLPGWRRWRDDTILVGVGTILKRKFLPDGARKLVIGSGVGYGDAPDIAAAPTEWDIRCVRGPRTAAALGLEPEVGIADAAILLPDLSAFGDLARGSDVLFVPHHGSIDRFDWHAILSGTGIRMLDPRGDAKDVVLALATARAVIAESMHAAIIADAFRVPWHCVAISNAFNDFKWQDWAESLNITLRPIRLFLGFRRLQRILSALRRRRVISNETSSPHARSQRILPKWLAPALRMSARRSLLQIARMPYHLSEVAVLEAKQARLREVLASIRQDYGC
jgi:succinoglycan biosynthesis protein ExoV